MSGAEDLLCPKCGERMEDHEWRRDEESGRVTITFRCIVIDDLITVTAFDPGEDKT